MEHKRVVSRKNLPTPSPSWGTIVAYLLLERMNAPGWVWGAAGVLFLIVWVGAIYAWIVEDQTEVF